METLDTNQLTTIETPENRLSAALRTAMDELPAEDRELLRAFYVDKRPLIELAGESSQTYKLSSRAPFAAAAKGQSEAAYPFEK